MSSEKLLEQMTPRQKLLWEAFTQKPERTLDELVKYVCEAEGQYVSRNSVNASVKFLGHRLSGTEWALVQSGGGLGRGNKSTYELKKMYIIDSKSQ